MNWKQWPWTRQNRSFDLPDKVYIEKDGLQNSYSIQEPSMLTRTIEDLLTGFYAAQNFIELFYAVPEVFAPVHEIASRVASAQWELVKEWNDEVDYNNSDFNRLFTNPNPLISFKDMVYQAVCYEILCGKEFFYYNYSNLISSDTFMSKVITWGNLPAAKVTMDTKKNVDPYTATSMSDFISKYIVPNDLGGQRTFEPEEVTPILHMDLRKGMNPTKCISMMEGARKPISNLIPVYEARGVIYVKRGMMGLLVSRKGDESGMIPLTKKEKQEVQDEMQEDYGLRRDKNQIGIASAPVDFIKTSMSIEELQPFEETLADAVAIYACLRVPRHLVPSKDKSTYNNAAADLKSFYSDVIIPWANRYAEIWTNAFGLKDQRRYIRANFDKCEALQENRKDAAIVDNTNGKTMMERFWNGACSLNEWIVSFGGTEVRGNELYNKKLLEMTPEEVLIIKNVLNSRTNVKATNPSEDTGVQAPQS